MEPFFRHRLWLAALIAAVCFSSLAASPPSPADQDSGGQTVIPPVKADAARWTLSTIAERTPVADHPHRTRIDVRQEGEVNWQAVMHSPANTVAVKKGDFLVYDLKIRVTGERTDVGDIAVFVESAVEGKSGYAGGRIHPTTQWQTMRRSLVCPLDFDAGEMRLSVHLAPKAQTLEFESVSVRSFPAGTPADQLGLEGLRWAGSEPDASWRGEAARRIEKLRKRDLTVRVVDADGNPVSGAAVRVQQTRHDWKFGTFLGSKMLGESADAVRYRQEVLRRFSAVTLPAYLADWGWRNDNSRRDYFRLADFAQKHGLTARGHLLVYPGWTATPSEWFTIAKPELRQKMAAHIPRAIRAFESRGVTEWDVANELRFNDEFMKEIGGIVVAADWFRQARELLPNGELYLNETVVLTNGGHTETEQSTLLAHAKTLTDAGAPIDGLGLQGHFNTEFTPPTRVHEILDRMSEPGFRLMITEFDMDNDDKRAQAAYLKDFFTVCFAHPAVDGIISWGFWQGDMWKPRGHHYTTDWQPTEVAEAYDELVLGTWWTEVDSETDAAGTVKLRAFAGDHGIRVVHDGYEQQQTIDLSADATVTVVVP